MGDGGSRIATFKRGKWLTCQCGHYTVTVCGLFANNWLSAVFFLASASSCRECRVLDSVSFVELDLVCGVMERVQRPRSEVQTAIIFNDQDETGRWIPLRIEIGSWVTIKPSSTGPWSRDARKHGEETYAGAWKAKVDRFFWSHWKVRDKMVMKLESILVRHAYQRRQLLLSPDDSALEPRARNYLYEIYWENWIPPTSVLDVILVLHHVVGEATRSGRDYKDLLDNGTFYLRAVYVPPSGSKLYGSLEPLPLPELTDPDWSIPDMFTLEAFRRKMADDIAAAMKGSTSSFMAHVQWFMPIHVMVDLFACAADSRRTPQLYVFRNPSDELMKSLMDKGWNEKHMIGRDVLKCIVNQASLIFRYHIGRETLYANFQYVRYRSEGPDNWVPIDQAVVVETVNIKIFFDGALLPQVEVGKSWPVSHLRNEISILLPRDKIPEDYDLVIERPGYPDAKINARREKCTEIGNVLPQDGRFKIVPV